MASGVLLWRGFGGLHLLLGFVLRGVLSPAGESSNRIRTLLPDLRACVCRWHLPVLSRLWSVSDAAAEPGSFISILAGHVHLGLQLLILLLQAAQRGQRGVPPLRGER